MEEIQFAGITMSALLTLIMSFIYYLLGDKISDRYRAAIAVVVGIGLGLLNIPYTGIDCTIVVVVNSVIAGFTIGLSSVGLYEIQRTVTRPRG